MVKGKLREMPRAVGSNWRAESSHCSPHPQPLERDMTAGLAGNVCLWTAAPEKRRRNKKTRTGALGGWGVQAAASY